MLWTMAILLAAAAPAEPKTAVIYGIGLNTCGQWLEKRRDPVTDIALGAWLGGFMTGRPVVRAGAEAPRLRDMTLWIDNYCRSHSLDEVAQAAEALTTELQSR